MIPFSNLIKLYYPKCYNKLFQNKIIDKFKKLNKEDEFIIHFGLNYPSEEIKNYKFDLHIAIIGHEFNNPKLMDFFHKNKDDITFYTLSKINQEYLIKNYNIESKVIIFDLPNIECEKNKKIYFFYKKNVEDDKEYNQNFYDYINNENNLFSNIKNIKIILNENFNYINNPYINIIITNNINHELLNIHFIGFTETLSNFKKNYNNFEDKYYHYKNNFLKINQYLFSFSKANKNISNKISNPNLHKLINNLYKFDTNSDNPQIIFSDNLEYLQSLSDNIVLKVFLTNNNEYIIKKIKNNFIIVNTYFFDENIFENLRKFHNNEKIPDNEIKYNHSSNLLKYNFIIVNNEDIQNLKNYINLFNKYNINIPIEIYSNSSFDINYKGNYEFINIDQFKPKENTKIYYSPKFSIDNHFNNIILKNNIEIKIIEKLNILIASTQYPSYGGAATNAYNIIKYFKKNNNINTFGLFIDNCDDIDKKADPDKIENVYGINYREFSYTDIQGYIFRLFGKMPDIAFCKNCMAPKLIKNTFPTCINIFLVSGIWGFSQIEFGVNELTDFTDIRRIPEEKSIELTNLIICNSNLTISYFKKIYHDIIHNKLHEKQIDTTKYNVMNTYNINYDIKNIDIISIASNVKRPVKNISFLSKILSFDKNLKKYKTVIIGENSEELFDDIKYNNLSLLPLLKQNQVENYLNKSKIIIIPSFFDSNSNVFREAVFNGVIPLISCNVAHPPNFPRFLIFDNYDEIEWAYKINYILDNYKEIVKKYNLIDLFKNNDDLIDFIF